MKFTYYALGESWIYNDTFFPFKKHTFVEWETKFYKTIIKTLFKVKFKISTKRFFKEK